MQLAEEVLYSAIDEVLEGLRDGRESLLTITVSVEGITDPSAAVWLSRRPGEHCFCFEQPDRDHLALAGLGEAVRIEAGGSERFDRVDARWRELSARSVTVGIDGCDAVSPIAVGGFSFAQQPSSSPHWQGYRPAALVVPELVLRRSGSSITLTLSRLVHGAEDPTQLAAEFEQRLRELRDGYLPLLDPDPAAPSRVASQMPPEHYEQAVAQAVERIRAGELEKIVLAREVQVHAQQGHSPAAVFSVLRDAFPSCYVFSVAAGSDTFLGASPELLVRCEGQRVSTVALAGSARRSADPSVDAHLGEQLLRSDKDRREHEIVVKSICRTLEEVALWLSVAEEPQLISIANVQHLATPIRAQLGESRSVIELAGRLHPTPAVAGEPRDLALGLIPALEGLDRGWYAGAVGYCEVDGDGEFCVALRSALLSDTVARCYAGVGVVVDSDPSAELAETEIKLQALLPVL